MSRNKFCSGHQIGKGSGQERPNGNNLEKEYGKVSGVSSSVLEWGPKGGTGSIQLEKNWTQLFKTGLSGLSCSSTL